MSMQFVGHDFALQLSRRVDTLAQRQAGEQRLAAGCFALYRSAMNPATFDLNLIRALDALLTEKNVTRAAAQLRVTQQAMSGSLRRLRLHFADELFVAVGRRLEPTPLGAALKDPVHELMLNFERMLHVTPKFEPSTSARRFRVALSDYAGIVFLPAFMPLLAARAPNVICEFRPMNNGVFNDLEQGNLDFCMLPSNWRLYQSTQPARLRSLKLFSDDFVCIVAEDNPDVGDILTADDYSALGHAELHFSGGVRSIVEDAWEIAGLDVKVVAIATSFTSLLFLVPGTRLIATAQRKLVNAFIAMLPIRSVECPIAIERLHEDLSWHARHDADPAHRFLRSLFAEAANTLNDQFQVLQPAIVDGIIRYD